MCSALFEACALLSSLLLPSLSISLTLSLSHSISLSLKAAKFEEPEYTVCHVRTDFCEGIEYERQDYSDRLTLRRAFIKSIEKLKSSHKVYLNRQIEELWWIWREENNRGRAYDSKEDGVKLVVSSVLPYLLYLSLSILLFLSKMHRCARMLMHTYISHTIILVKPRLGAAAIF